MRMWVAFEIIFFLTKLFWYWMVSVVLFFVPTRFIGKDIRGKTVLITGAGGGVGRLLSEKFAKRGCHLVLWDVDQELMEQTLNSVRSKYSTVAVSEEVGVIDILVNNAGVVFGKFVMDSSDDQMIKTMEVNCLAHYWTCKAFLPNMIKQNSGHLVTIASSAGLMGVAGIADYCASKFAAVGFQESLSLELAHRGINGVKITVVCPYWIDTGMFDGCTVKFPFLLKALKPEYVANSIVSAVLREDEILFLPKFVYWSYFFKSLLPVRCQHLIHTFLGTITFMDTFKGHHHKTS
ncbi:short-chain dehydrogenase/reductase family 16C member 6 [Biomphalaria pfeifferi]|uniref:Short-chain dehydrogenase/reductase family 16C member 6 n=1 Tax=Biomphalaria pfeifferi TaxID=112525 RepID=A0AAD8F8S7_BIOPF|nr:short-chain dehydrogenase/reductase family 16C member 6 [Biomphalaria pfeifferi]